MNQSEVVTRIKLKLGLNAIATPFDDINSVIMEILNTITIPVFSKYYPYKEEIKLNLNDLTLLEKTNQYKIYLLPEFVHRKLLYVFDCVYDASCMSGLGFGYYGEVIPLMTGNAIQQSMLSNATAQLISTMLPKMTFKYEAPRKLYIYNAYSSYKVILKVGFEHDRSMASIPDTASESFMELALLDVKENLYPTLKRYNNIPTAIGNIDLKIDDWENAENDRKELINRWDDTYHLDFQSMYWY